MSTQQATEWKGDPRLIEYSADLSKIEDEKFSEILSSLQKKQDEWYVTKINLKRTEREGGHYGDLIWRKWKTGEVFWIQGNKIYQKSLKPLDQWTPGYLSLSEMERRELFEFECEAISKAIHPKQGLTKENLVELGNFAFVTYVFQFLCERTGMGMKLQEDMAWFFLDREGQGVGQPLDRDNEKDPERSGGARLSGLRRDNKVG